MVPQGYKFFWGAHCSNEVLYPKMGYGWQPWNEVTFGIMEKRRKEKSRKEKCRK